MSKLKEELVAIENVLSNLSPEAFMEMLKRNGYEEEDVSLTIEEVDNMRKFVKEELYDQNVDFLVEENKKLREAGMKLAEASLRVIRTYDGVHRLSKAVSEWCATIAGEGGRR